MQIKALNNLHKYWEDPDIGSQWLSDPKKALVVFAMVYLPHPVKQGDNPKELTVTYKCIHAKAKGQQVLKNSRNNIEIYKMSFRLEGENKSFSNEGKYKTLTLTKYLYTK